MLENNLKDGYYLFVYSEIDNIMNALRVSLRHDHNMALFKKKDGTLRLVRHWEFERVTGYKHHNVAFADESKFIEFINLLLGELGLNYEMMEEVIGTPFSKAKDISCLFENEDVAYHAISHLFSSMLSDSEKFVQDDLIALSFDGGPDILIDKYAEKKNLFCGAVVKKGKIKNIFGIPSPGAYWAYASSYFNIPEGTLMALAYACTAETNEVFEEFPEYKRITDKLKFENYMNNILNRIMNYDLEIDSKNITKYDCRFSEKENKISMIMKVLQKKSIQQCHRIIDQIINEYDLNPQNTRLALSGGFALNCPTNSELMNSYRFKEQLCCPCVNDGGLAIGMGLHYFYCNNIINFKMENAFYGSEDKRDIVETLKPFNNYIENISYGLDEIAEDIDAMPIVWFNSNAEIGPRALGHRSIIANPNKIEHKDLLNKYKIREWWRPVAPIVLQEYLTEWFEDSFRSDYMLNNFKICDDKEKIVPAIMHLDKTCRVQTVNKDIDPTMYEIIRRFYEKTKIPIVCNTSLNDHGEPIINRIEEAINFALRKNIEVVYINCCRIKLKDHSKYSKKSYLKRNDSMFTINEDCKVKILEKENPYNLSTEDLMIYKYNYSLQKYDIKNKTDVVRLSKVINKIKMTSSDLKGIEIIARNTN